MEGHQERALPLCGDLLNRLNVTERNCGAPAIVGRRLHPGFARSRSIRHRDWREIKVTRDPSLALVGRAQDKGSGTHLLRACLNEFGEGGMDDPLNQGAVVDVGVRVATLVVLRKASVFRFFC